MKTLNQFITEALIKKPSDKKTKVKPKNKKELTKIISETIEKEGYHCDLNFIDTSEINDMEYLFFGSFLGYFDGDISEWDVSNVTNMSHMFENGWFNGDISKWDVSNVKSMAHMFSNSLFNGDISGWDVSNAEFMNYMFADSKFNGDVSKWDVFNLVSWNGIFEKTPLRKIYGDTPEISLGHFVKK